MCDPGEFLSDSINAAVPADALQVLPACCLDEPGSVPSPLSALEGELDMATSLQVGSLTVHSPEGQLCLLLTVASCVVSTCFPSCVVICQSGLWEPP